MHLWGLSINIVSCINLVIAIGLAVDYSAHIGHCFMTFVGDRNGKHTPNVSFLTIWLNFGYLLKTCMTRLRVCKKRLKKGEHNDNEPSTSH